MHAKSVARHLITTPHRQTAQAPQPTAAATVDADVTHAVTEELARLCAESVAYSRSLDPVFATDVAERLAAFTLGGGSRIRPRFLWWAMRACGGTDSHAAGALRLAAALELIQSCALVHDDVMDQSAVRRGRPSFHAQIALQFPANTSPEEAGPAPFAQSVAVLAGDLALSWADDIVAGTDLDPPVRTDILRIWRAMRTEMVAGQYLDLHGQATASRSAAQAIRTVCLKTARYTVEQPLALGAALTGTDDTTRRSLAAAGRCAGIAFQLRDDLLGVFGDPAVTGKPSGDDLRSGKATYLLALAHARARATGDTDVIDLLQACRGSAPLSGPDLASVRTALHSTGAPAHVERRIDRLARTCERHLAAARLHGPAARHLTELLGQVASPPPHDDAAGPAARRGGAR
ncbi:polyprenyl synthetase family protein [Streptomyces antarcticus]|uniref:polyprenyl synthetase family protein n=1 Tax=Streptomyces antarcticus TaxID=2996458 RepID=UPI002271B8A1|nr:MULTISPECIES: polyprenyl synthetase family protein [unclassified Streptomyces]MCY0946092.1 polyprenyl synthetase family protein [Streptomyces sp. H34-AA3]MCZ4081084.1 polyprenyl synthetase family protein [Streptomyces sp. H34-S5]